MNTFVEAFWQGVAIGTIWCAAISVSGLMIYGAWLWIGP